MSIVFIPASDLSTVAADAATIDEIDLEYVQVGESKSASFRIGNTGDSPVTVAIATDDSWLSISVGQLTTNANAISDTIVATVSPPLATATAGRVATISANSAELNIIYSVVGPFDERGSQSPERRSSFTDNVSDVIARVGEPFVLHRYDPIPWNPDDQRVFISVRSGYKWLDGDTANHRFVSPVNPCDRLDALNSDWGYVHSSATIIASFQLEDFSIRENFSAGDTVMTFDAGARLTIPAEYDLIRAWALFADQTGADRETYKRSVFLIQRQSRLWSLHNINSRYRGNELSHHVCDLIPLHERATGSSDFYNPFAFVFSENSDKPYAVYPCDHSLISLAEQIDASGSGSLYNPSVV